MTMISSLVNYSRRQLQTIVSREIIKPSSPTPSHLKTHNLSLIDQIAPDAYMPMVIFYPNSSIHTSSSTAKLVAEMKNSLAQTLTHYYPFAGRLAKTTPSSIDCNDEGIEFVEACNDQPLSNFLQKIQHEELDQLFPNGLIWKKLRCYSIENDQTSPLAVQVNSFTCGGIAVAVSLSHKVGDGSSLCNFFKDWATLTRSRLMGEKYVSPDINPRFISFKSANLNFQGFAVDKSLDNCVTRSFIFPGSKINELKRRVIAMTMETGQPITNPTRVEVLNWLLYKCAVEAATKNRLGSFRPTGLLHVVNLRNKMINPLPETGIGNFFNFPGFPTIGPNDITPSSFISRLKKLKMEFQSIPDIQTVVERLSCLSSEAIREEEQRKIDEGYLFTSLCNYPIDRVDFGWGKPIKATLAGTMKNNSFIAMDALDGDGDGMEALVSLKTQDMEIFQADPHLLSFC